MNTATRHALEEAQTMRFLALAFERPRPGWLKELFALSEAIDDPRFAEIADAARDADEGVYHALLGPGGPASPREVAHRGLEDPGRLLSEIALAHHAFGYSPKAAEDPRDHLAVEADFVAYLWLKEAFAIQDRDDEARRVTRAAREGFAARHLGLLAHRFAARLGDSCPAYLAGATQCLLERLPPPPTPAARPGLPILDEEEILSCGIPDPESS